MAARKRAKKQDAGPAALSPETLDAIRRIVSDEVRLALLDHGQYLTKSTTVDARGVVMTAPPRPRMPWTPGIGPIFKTTNAD